MRTTTKARGYKETCQAVHQSQRGQEVALKSMQANLQSPQPLLVGGKSENNIPDLFGVLAPLAEIWLKCVELLQSLFGSFSPCVMREHQNNFKTSSSSMSIISWLIKHVQNARY